jgi:hypothetical protein
MMLEKHGAVKSVGSLRDSLPFILWDEKPTNMTQEQWERLRALARKKDPKSREAMKDEPKPEISE